MRPALCVLAGSTAGVTVVASAKVGRGREVIAWRPRAAEFRSAPTANA
jgi:hypothetical protein